MSRSTALVALLNNSLETVFTAAVLHVRQSGAVGLEHAVGWLDPETKTMPVESDTLFDLASVTKLFTLTTFLTLVAERSVSLDDPVKAVLPEFQEQRPIAPYEDPLKPGQFITVSEETGSVDAGAITFRHLLTHTSGLPAWRPLFRHPPGQIREIVLNSHFAYPTGSHVVYSDLGLILVGWAIEALTGLSLDQAIRQRVLEPLGRPSARFGPVPPQQSAPTEYCHWRQKRMHGEVHDENAWALGGVSGHAGLFGTAAAVATLGQAWLAALQGQAGALLPPTLAAEAVRLQAQEEMVRRGIGWLLWSPNVESFTHVLSQKSFGHTGFTGTSLMVDPERELVIALLTNDVYHGREARSIMPFRTAVHRAIIEIESELQ